MEKKQPGRKKGTANRKGTFKLMAPGSLRKNRLEIRVSDIFLEAIEWHKKNGINKSSSDIIHEAIVKLTQYHYRCPIDFFQKVRDTI